MGRWVVFGLLCALLLGGCGNADQQLTDAAAQSARQAESEVNTTRLVVEQLQVRHLWRRTAVVMVTDAEKSVAKAVSSFDGQQPSTNESRRMYEQVGEALDNAQKAVTATRIALGNDDLAAALRQFDVLRRSADELDRIGEQAT
ncbi:hypothetical protein E0H75_30705 [Kribbella capetownensis]|uniref:Uncharacterized protein n=1 Tax=Kribbella capetownensis TaxID=1572659 RepID=A0A4R0JFR4_9ACTN|nr:hypothetical protein [Kribbella capetownensis]TCC44900.1 hypothetical protein E0H75_30705 [Kribbella capetownensis]